MTQPTTNTHPIAATMSGPAYPRLLMLASLPALAALAALLATQAHAQATEPAAAASASAASAPVPAASTTTFYDPKELERAFKFMDKTGDGKISRDEASNFRGVSKHFDEADTNKDGFLSREEFDNAMNKSLKSKAP